MQLKLISFWSGGTWCNRCDWNSTRYVAKCPECGTYDVDWEYENDFVDTNNDI